MLTQSQDEGSLTLLVIGYTFIAALLIVIGIDVSKVFLAQRALASTADAAALAGAQAVDRAAVYAGTRSCDDLPVDPSAAASAAEEAVGEASATLVQTFATVSPPDVRVGAQTVQVRLAGQVRVPFGRVLALLLPDHPDGRVAVDAEAAATTSLTAPAC